MEENVGVKILQNPIIIDFILKRLDPPDSNVVRRLSKDINDLVLKSKLFYDNTRAIISPETVSNPVVFNNNKKWKNLRIDLNQSTADIIRSRHMFENAKNIKIEVSNRTQHANVISMLILIAKKSQHLTSLAMELDVLNYDLTRFFTNPSVSTMLQNLKHLEFYASESSKSIKMFAPIRDEDGNVFFTKNLLGFRSAQMMMLESFIMPSIQIHYRDPTAVGHIAGIVSKNKDTLTQLHLHHHVWVQNVFEPVVFPKLERLYIKTGTFNYATVSTFIKNQSLLKHLSVDMRPILPLPTVFETIRNTSSELKSLNIKTERFSPCYIQPDWTWLVRIEGLEQFTFSRSGLEFPERNEVIIYGEGRQLLTLLPRTVKKLKLKGILKFWNDHELELNCKLTAFKPFQHLVELSLLRCFNALDDSILQFICKHFTCLKLLEFSHCKYVTDFGITGIKNDSDEDSGISLTNLESLEKLTVRDCKSITQGGIIQVVKFPLLKDFEYITPAPVSIDFITLIANQNPSLESIFVHVSIQQDINAIKTEFAVNYPRIKNLINKDPIRWKIVDGDSESSSHESFTDTDGDNHSSDQLDLSDNE